MLQIRYHPKFQGKDTLLFAGSRNDIDRLRCLFFAWDGEELKLLKHLKAQEALYQFAVGELQLTRDRMKSAFFWKGDQGVWFISSSFKNTYVSVLDELLSSDQPGHRYLGYAGPGHVQVMVSNNELPISPSGKIIRSIVRSKEGVAFTDQSVAVVRRHVTSFERDNIIPCLSIGVDKYYQKALYLAGNSIERHSVMRPPPIADQLEDASFYWHTDQLDLIRNNYYIDVDHEHRAYLIPVEKDCNKRDRP